MKFHLEEGYLDLLLSEGEIYLWVNKSGAEWPCSDLLGSSLFVEYDSNGICEVTNSKVTSDELNACVADHLENCIPNNHPMYYIVIGQFITKKELDVIYKCMGRKFETILEASDFADQKSIELKRKVIVTRFEVGYWQPPSELTVYTTNESII